MTWGFLYLVIFLLGFTLALVGGLARRILHPSELCDHVVVPSHEHWASLRTPKADAVVAFLTAFGLAAVLVHGLTSIDPVHEALIAGLVGVILAVVIRTWLCRGVAPADPSSYVEGSAMVVRSIPAEGFGQVSVDVCGCPVKLAARSASGRPIEAGTTVRVLDRSESVLVVTAEDRPGA